VTAPVLDRGSWLLFAGGLLVNVDTLDGIDSTGKRYSWAAFESSVQEAVHAYLASRAVAVRDPVGESIHPDRPWPWAFDPRRSQPIAGDHA
jgi:hypothetical protein